MTKEMKIVTQRDLIRDVAKNWDEQYLVTKTNRSDDKAVIYARLIDLDLDEVSADEVNYVIGNGSWTAIDCHSCEQDVERIILMKGMADDEYGPSRFCYDCIRYALSMFEAGR